MPGEEHLKLGLRLNILASEVFKQFIGHCALPRKMIEVLLLQVVAILAAKIAGGSNGFGHHIERTRKRHYRVGHLGLICFWFSAAKLAKVGPSFFFYSSF